MINKETITQLGLFLKNSKEYASKGDLIDFIVKSSLNSLENKKSSERRLNIVNNKIRDLSSVLKEMNKRKLNEYEKRQFGNVLDEVFDYSREKRELEMIIHNQ